MDQCLQASSTPVLGPLWISTGEHFRPQGVHDFLVTLIKYAQSLVKRAERYKDQITLSQDESTVDQVEIVTIMWMKKEEKQRILKVVCKYYLIDLKSYVVSIWDILNL